MSFGGKSWTAVIGAVALSGTLMVPSSKSSAAAQTVALQVEIAQQADISQATQPTPSTQIPVAAEPQPAEAQVLPRSEPEPSVPTRARSIDSSELECLTRVMLYEAGAEGREGQTAVGHVVLNRVRSSRFPNSICSVIYQRGQFSSIRSFSPPRNSRWNRAQDLARDIMAGETQSNVGTALYFHASRVRPAYVRNHTRVAQVGNHLFYR
jgi:spore germination cell wall hydrolase CwlJ-like protein